MGVLFLQLQILRNKINWTCNCHQQWPSPASQLTGSHHRSHFDRSSTLIISDGCHVTSKWSATCLQYQIGNQDQSLCLDNTLLCLSHLHHSLIPRSEAHVGGQGKGSFKWLFCSAKMMMSYDLSYNHSVFCTIWLIVLQLKNGQGDNTSFSTLPFQIHMQTMLQNLLSLSSLSVM